jgi:hypothetical protein
MFKLLLTIFLSIIILYLLLIPYFSSCKREGLDNCPPLENQTTTGLKNISILNSLTKTTNNIQNTLADQITSNTKSLQTLNTKYNEVLSLNKEIKDLTKKSMNLQKAVANFGNQLQNKGFSVANTSKKDMPNPLPQVQANAYTGRQREI